MGGIRMRYCSCAGECIKRAFFARAAVCSYEGRNAKGLAGISKPFFTIV